MKRTSVAILLGAALSWAVPAMAQLAPFIDPAMAKQAKVPLARARTLALQVRKGKVTDERIEREKGGSGLRWSFNIQVGKQGYEVGIDAKTGKLLENIKSGLSPL